MCEVPLYIDQFKNMASLDYAEIANNLSREVMVLFIEMPEAREQIFAIKDAAQCASEFIEIPSTEEPPTPTIVDETIEEDFECWDCDESSEVWNTF